MSNVYNGDENKMKKQHVYYVSYYYLDKSGNTGYGGVPKNSSERYLTISKVSDEIEKKLDLATVVVISAVYEGYKKVEVTE